MSVAYSANSNKAASWYSSVGSAHGFAVKIARLFQCGGSKTLRNEFAWSAHPRCFEQEHFTSRFRVPTTTDIRDCPMSNWKRSCGKLKAPVSHPSAYPAVSEPAAVVR